MFFKNHGILGINARNLLYVKPYNPKKAIKMADNKIKTKQFLSARGIPVPKLYGIIRTPEELERYDFNTLNNSFVLKPNNGYGGEGIIPVVDKKDNYYITPGNKKYSKKELKEQINDILYGRYSISNISDSAFFEQLIVSDELIGKFSYEGLPDIRVVVHNLIPVMAMLRLPTKESGGKANLHMGAVGIGIDIAKGEATHISYKNKIIDELPNGLGSIKGTKIPYWNDILQISSKVQLVTNLGYMAVDIAIDKNNGPVLLEINARAGLGVQIANLAPLRRRLERIEGIKVTTPTKGVRIAKDMFGHTIEKEIANISGKQVVSTQEEIEIILKTGMVKANAKINTGRERSIIDEEFAEKIGLLENIENYDDEKSTIKLKFTLKNQRIQTIADLEKTPKDVKMILGARDLKNFLIDTSITGNTIKSIKQEKIKQKEENIIKIIKPNNQTDYRAIDQKIINVDSKIKLLYHLRPINLEEEEKEFFKTENYNPIFKYPQIKFNPIELIKELEDIECDKNSPLGKIFCDKKEETIKKIALIESIGEEDFTEISKQLFSIPDQEEVKECLKYLKELKNSPKEEATALYNAEEAKIEFEKTFEKYGLKDWKVKIKESMVANCVAGKNNRLFVKKNAKFSRDRIENLIVHEIETHIITAENGKMQPYEIFNRGTANYLITQEGMAMYNVEKQKHDHFFKNYKALAHVIAINNGKKEGFKEIYNELIKLNIPKKQAFRSALKAKRGIENTKLKGVFTKDYIYYKGYKQVKEFIKSGHKIEELYIGKINLNDLDTVKKIPSMIRPTILPTWLKK